MDEHPNSVAIAQANARLLRGLGTEHLEQMVAACRLGMGAAAVDASVDEPEMPYPGEIIGEISADRDVVELLAFTSISN